MKPFFKELFLYNHNSNKKLIELLTNQSAQIPEKALFLFNHILNAHEVWNSRINLQAPSFGVWEKHPASQFKILDHANYLNSLLIINSPDLENVVAYSDTKGVPFTNSIRDILFHVINHSTYHRGQIAMELRVGQIEPLATDYIIYKRENK
jgi:uncharacterized damage-inducible protein DinB